MANVSTFSLVRSSLKESEVAGPRAMQRWMTSSSLLGCALKRTTVSEQTKMPVFLIISQDCFHKFGSWSSYCSALNPFTPESDRCQISPAASPEILHHTVWRTWLFLAYSDER